MNLDIFQRLAPYGVTQLMAKTLPMIVNRMQSYVNDEAASMHLNVQLSKIS